MNQPSAAIPLEIVLSRKHDGQAPKTTSYRWDFTCCHPGNVTKNNEIKERSLSLLFSHGLSLSHSCHLSLFKQKIFKPTWTAKLLIRLSVSES